MAKRLRSPKPEEIEKRRGASGWYLYGWRTFRNLTLDELAADSGISRSFLNDIEKGKVGWGRNDVERLAIALNTTQGHLIHTNPFTTDNRLRSITDGYERLDDSGREAVAQLVATLAARAA